MISLSGVLALSLAGPAMAFHGFKATGTVTAGSLLVHVTETVAPCDEESSFNGVDGHWYDIEGFGGHNATLTMDAEADFDAFWYDESCDLIDDNGMAQKDLGETERALVPNGANFVIVNLFVGANATFTLKLC